MIEAAHLLVIALCMLGEAFFSGMETGVISIHRMRLRHFIKQGSTRADLLQRFLDQPDRLLGTTLLGTNICVVMISVLGASLMSRLIGDWGKALSALVVAVLLLVFCEYLPKAWFHARPLERSRRFVGMLKFWESAFRPLSVSVIWLTKWLVPGGGEAFQAGAPFVTKEDLKILAHEGERDGVLSPRERFMIHRVFELSRKRAHEIMTPRAEMTLADRDMALADFLSIARHSGFTRIPAHDGTKDEFVGIINVFDALPSLSAPAGKTVADFVRPPLFIPGSMPVDDILPRLRRSCQPMCLVKDDSGAVVGLVTTEDILEEIVGKL